VLAVNVSLLSCYTFGCHSLRHLIGGFSDLISKSPARKSAYDCVSCLNGPYALRLVESVHGRLLRPLRPHVFHGCLDRLETLLMAEYRHLNSTFS